MMRKRVYNYFIVNLYMILSLRVGMVVLLLRILIAIVVILMVMVIMV